MTDPVPFYNSTSKWGSLFDALDNVLYLLHAALITKLDIVTVTLSNKQKEKISTMISTYETIANEEIRKPNTYVKK